VRLRRTWIVAVLSLGLIAVAAVTAVVLLGRGSKPVTAQELAHTIVTSTDADARSGAARELAARLEPASVASVARLAGSAQAKAGLRLLGDELFALYDEPKASPDQRRWAVLCLGQIGDSIAARVVVKALLSDPSPAVRDAAATALAHTGSLSPALVERLVTARQDATTDEAKKRTARVIVAIGTPALPSLLAVIRDELVPEDSWATKLIGEIGLPALPLLRSRLGSSDFKTEVTAAFGLLELRKRSPARIRPMLAQIISKMMARLGAPVPGEYELHVLAEIGKPAVDELVSLAQKPYASLPPSKQKQWANTAYALSTIAKLNPGATSTLVAALHRRDYDLIARFSLFFIMLGKPGSEDVLIEALNTRGGSEMTLFFLNSGNPKLDRAARAWAASHGFTITFAPGASPSTWGTAHD
jgi:HEAT repeat protein